MLGVIVQKCCWAIRGDSNWNSAVSCILAHKQALLVAGSTGERHSSSSGHLHAEVRSQSVGCAGASIPAGCCNKVSTSSANCFSSAEASIPGSVFAYRVFNQQHRLRRPVQLTVHTTAPRLSALCHSKIWKHGGRCASATLPFPHAMGNSAATGICRSNQATHMSAECLGTLGVSLKADRAYVTFSGASRQGSSRHPGCTPKANTDGKQEMPINLHASGPSPISKTRAVPRLASSTGSAFAAVIAAIKEAGTCAHRVHHRPANRHFDHRQLTAAIQACHSVQQLQQLLLLVGEDINYISVSAAIVKLQKLLCQLADEQQTIMLGRPLLSQFLQLLQPKLAQCGARELANVIYALCLMPTAMQEQHQAAIQQTLLPELELRLKDAKPQEVSNVLYALAKSGQQPDPVLVQHLLRQLCRRRDAVKPQEVSNSLWAMAKMGHQVSGAHWLLLLDVFIRKLDRSKFQEMQTFMQAAAKLGLQLDRQSMLVMLDALHGKLHEANAQGVANVLWACDQFNFYPKQLLAAAEVSGVLPAANLLELTQIAHACGQLGHRGEHLMAAVVQQAVQWVAGRKGDIRSNSRLCLPYVLCSICWAIAVLNLQQHAPDVLLLMQACSQEWDSMATGGFEQLHQVHTWLLDCQLAGGQGLLGTLTPQQLQQCKEAWDEQMLHQQKAAVGKFQQAVFAAVQQLPISWQEPPQMEQLSVGRNGEVDGAALIDITARTADGVLLAIEADGPWHFRQPDGALTGTTLYRNRALAARGYQVISIPYYLWGVMWGKQQEQQQYLTQLVRAADRQQYLQQMSPAASLQSHQPSPGAGQHD